MIRLFCGFDNRESIGSYVFAHSVVSRASEPVQITFLHENGLPTGTNSFTVSRFLVPYFLNFQGKAIFADGADMICQADIAELVWQMQDMTEAVKVVKHEYKTKHPIKYLGTELESPNIDYPRKNWASLMLINCDHPAWRNVKPEILKEKSTLDCLQFEFLLDSEIGEILNPAWNTLVDEGQPVEGAKILHWTAGIPGFKHYADAPGAELWWEECRRMTYPLPT